MFAISPIGAAPIGTNQPGGCGPEECLMGLADSGCADGCAVFCGPAWTPQFILGWNP